MQIASLAQFPICPGRRRRMGIPLISLSAAVIGPFIFCTWWFRRGGGRYWDHGGSEVSVIRLSKSFSSCDLYTALLWGFAGMHRWNMTGSLSLIFPLITQHARKLHLKSLQHPANIPETPQMLHTSRRALLARADGHLGPSGRARQLRSSHLDGISL